MNIVYFKDRFMNAGECHISLTDRSFRFGDGIFETLLVAGGKIYDLPAHIHRLKVGLKELRIKPLAVYRLPAVCEELISRNKIRNGYLRILVSRGEDMAGAFGYLPKGSKPYFIVQAVEKPYPEFKPVRLWQSSYRTGFNAPCKTNNALLYTMAMLEASEQSCDNALLLDSEGHICETASGNLFWIKDDVLYTPDTALPFVPGTIRSKVLKLWKGKIRQGRFKANALKAAQEVFMVNTGCLLVPVVAVDPLKLRFKAGPHTASLRQKIDEEIKRKLK